MWSHKHKPKSHPNGRLFCWFAINYLIKRLSGQYPPPPTPNNHFCSMKWSLPGSILLTSLVCSGIKWFWKGQLQTLPHGQTCHGRADWSVTPQRCRTNSAQWRPATPDSAPEHHAAVQPAEHASRHVWQLRNKTKKWKWCTLGKPAGNGLSSDNILSQTKGCGRGSVWGEGEVGWMGVGGRLQLPADQEVGIGEQVCSREGMGLGCVCLGGGGGGGGGGGVENGRPAIKKISPIFYCKYHQLHQNIKNLFSFLNCSFL